MRHAILDYCMNNRGCIDSALQMIPSGLLLETVNEIEPFTLIGIRNNDSMQNLLILVTIVVPERTANYQFSHFIGIRWLKLEGLG